MSHGADPVGTLDAALAHAALLLETRPLLSAHQAQEILRVLPGHPTARLLLARAKLRLDAVEDALPLLEALDAAQPGVAIAQCELGLTLRRLGRSGEAVASLNRAVALQPDLAPAWLALAEIHTDIGDVRGADLAYAQHIKCVTRDPRMRAAGAALYENRLPEAESLLRARIREQPADVAALRMLAEVAARLRRYEDAEVLLRHCVALAPSFMAARHNLALVLHRQNKAAEALSVVDHCLTAEPRQVSHRNLKAAILGTVGEYQAALQLYREVLNEYPNHAKVWMSFGHALKTAGHEEDCIEAYRRSLKLMPDLGEAYWSLANLKTFRFTPQDVGAMRTALSTAGLDAQERLHFHFALGKALEDDAQFEESFEQYAEGNRLRRLDLGYDADAHHERLARSHEVFTAEFLRDRAGAGCRAPDPIFIVGLPRAGSTLLEQILASHPQVEGTMELPDVIAIARRLAGIAGIAGIAGTAGTAGSTGSAAGAEDGEGARYPGVLGTLSDEQWRGVGEEYLERTRIHRKRGTPFFIDKMPNNFEHLGLILVALPNAKIIDARRHPLACCLSAFKQHFAMGQRFSYSLEDLGRYYRDYVALMAHFDRAAPGRVHRVIYEQMVDDTEAQVRALLDYCGLPFESSCMRFYENTRGVRTASSQQVRQPIFRDGVDQWRNFEPWLLPLKQALGPALTAYRGVP